MMTNWIGDLELREFVSMYICNIGDIEFIDKLIFSELGSNIQ